MMGYSNKTIRFVEHMHAHGTRTLTCIIHRVNPTVRNIYLPACVAGHPGVLS